MSAGARIWSRMARRCDGCMGVLALLGSAWLVSAMAASVPPLPPASAGAPPSAGATDGHDMAALAQRLHERLNVQGGGTAQDWTLLARSHAALGAHERADAAYARALADTPRDAQLLAERAQSRLMMGTRADAQDVRTLVDAALAIDAGVALALALRGDAAYERGEFAAARTHWQSAHERVAAGDDELAASLAQRLGALDSAQRALDAALLRP
jgi:cytochrome c-type biogenesis protein CcmH